MNQHNKDQNKEQRDQRYQQPSRGPYQQQSNSSYNQSNPQQTRYSSNQSSQQQRNSYGQSSQQSSHQSSQQANRSQQYSGSGSSSTNQASSQARPPYMSTYTTLYNPRTGQVIRSERKMNQWNLQSVSTKLIVCYQFWNKIFRRNKSLTTKCTIFSETWTAWNVRKSFLWRKDFLIQKKIQPNSDMEVFLISLVLSCCITFWEK